jgi:hypothetical protein
MPRRKFDDPDPPVGTSQYPVLFPGVDWGGQVYTPPAIPDVSEGMQATSLSPFARMGTTQYSPMGIFSMLLRAGLLGNAIR